MLLLLEVLLKQKLYLCEIISVLVCRTAKSWIIFSDERGKKCVFSGIKAICLYKHSDVIYRDCFFSNVLFCSLRRGHVRTHLSPMWKDVLNQWVLWPWLKVTFLSWLEYSFFTVSKGSKCHNHTHMLSIGQRQIQIERVWL